MITRCKCYLLDEQEGEFVAEDGRKVEYHNARFYDLDGARIFKARVGDGTQCPPPMCTGLATFEVIAGERFCRIEYRSFDPEG